MAETIVEERVASKTDQWRERIAEQERSGVSVRLFCRERGLTEYSFYAWRRRLRQQDPVRFALVERGTARQESAIEANLELLLATGDRLRISAGVDAATLRTVIDALRA
jgi:hypothetical protein